MQPWSAVQCQNNKKKKKWSETVNERKKRDYNPYTDFVAVPFVGLSSWGLISRELSNISRE